MPRAARLAPPLPLPCIDGVALRETVADGGEDGGDHPVGGGSVEGELRGQLRAEFGPVHVVLPL